MNIDLELFIGLLVKVLEEMAIRTPLENFSFSSRLGSISRILILHLSHNMALSHLSALEFYILCNTIRKVFRPIYCRPHMENQSKFHIEIT